MSNVYANSPSGGKWEEKFKEWFKVDLRDDPRIIWRNEAYGLLLRFDDKPVTEGHVLAVPWEAAQMVDDLADPRSDKLGRVARAAGRHLAAVLSAEGRPPRYVGQLVAGGQVWHAHVHRAPCFVGPDWLEGFSGQNPRLDPTDEEWEHTIHRFGDTFDGAALDAELTAMGPAEDLKAMEQYALDLRDRRLAR